MTSQFIGEVVTRKKEVKAESYDSQEKLKKAIKNLESELFTQKIEAESLKIDKKYFEEQMKELQRANEELRVESSIQSKQTSQQS